MVYVTLRASAHFSHTNNKILHNSTEIRLIPLPLWYVNKRGRQGHTPPIISILATHV
jgi:hypothetical protein